MTPPQADRSHDCDEPSGPPSPSITQLLRKARLTLTQVAERSHLLAMNARIEAAHCQDSGGLAAISNEMSEMVALMRDVFAEIEAASAS